MSFKKRSIPWNKGKTGVYSEETLKKMREAKKKYHQIHPPTKGFTGRKHSEKSKEKMRETYKNNKFSDKRKRELQRRMQGNHYSWRGGRIKDIYGYILIRKPKHPFCKKNGYIKEHRLIIGKYLERYLLPKEVCHHINEIRDDNRPENLMVFVNCGIHRKFHRNPANVKPEEIIFDGRLI